MIRTAVLSAVVAVSVAVIACSGPRGGVERLSPAPDFNYITGEQLESTMWQLAVGIRSLQAIFDQRRPLTQGESLEVIDILEQMIVATDELGPDGVSTNHPRITHNLGRFREKLAIARNSAAMSPPRYYLVGHLSGTCLACHASM